MWWALNREHSKWGTESGAECGELCVHGSKDTVPPLPLVVVYDCYMEKIACLSTATPATWSGALGAVGTEHGALSRALSAVSTE